MRFLIHMSTSEEAGSLARMLRLWTWSTCADMETELWSPGASGPAIPDGFLQKPVRQSALFTALRRCAKLWWDSLERLEILSDRLRVRLPLCDLIWAEGARRGCLVHSSHECISNRESLSALEARLPGVLFFRCQRSFLVNLTHVQALDSQGLHMSDGAVIPLSRNSRGAAVQAYQRVRRLMEEGPAPEEEEGNVHD